MKKKYTVFPGWMYSKNDNDDYFISATQLMRLYGVNPLECVVVREGEPVITRGLIILRPRYDGNYTIPCPQLQTTNEKTE